ncbi:MAG: NAD-dependent epimerase/dehydratase family protein [Candidatus Atribacteria bacterium]|nr:NAD-dependent epimerase/dehydratase family protein [Candidatus Atribacteria bacterium]
MTKKKNILLLGGFGFIGSNLIEELIKTDFYNIIVFEFKSIIQQFADYVTVYQGNFDNRENLEEIFKNHKIDIVVHLISTTIPATSNDEILYDINSNLISTLHLLDVMLKYDTKRIVFLSSGGTIYGDNKGQKSLETHPTNPICSYGIIKLAIENYLLLYNRLQNLEYLILRISNPYGEFHNSDKQGIINVVIKNILQNKKIIVWGDGSIVRDYIYVKDLAKIIIRLFEKNIYNQTINIGRGEGYSVNQVLEYILEIQPNFEIEYKQSRKCDIQKIILNTDKLNSLLTFGFTNLKTGITLTYQYYKNQL